MKGEIEDLRPCAADGRSCCVLVLFTPDEDLAIVGRRGQDCAKFRMRLGRNSLARYEIKSLYIKKNGERTENYKGMVYTYPCNAPHRALVSFISSRSATRHWTKAIEVALTPSKSQSNGASRPRSQISLLFCPKSMLPIGGHNNPGQHHAKLREWTVSVGIDLRSIRHIQSCHRGQNWK